jgi:hypothetical protein
MSTKEEYVFDVDHDEVFVKDMNLSSFIKKFSVLRPLAERMRKHLPDGYQNYLVDFIVQDCLPEERTCRDIRWHVDGDWDKENRYVLWVKGPNRTLFPAQVPQIAEFPCDRNEQNRFLEKMMDGMEEVEVPEQTIISYDSRTPHRGVKCKVEGKRHFVRMMATNYIKPKNIVR